MDINDNVDARNKAAQVDQLEDGAANAGAAPLIAANLAGVNTGSSTTLTGAPATGLGEEGAAARAATGDADADQINLDMLEQFGSARRETADEGVSERQNELEARELNG